MPEMAKLTLGDKTYELPIVEGSENEKGIDVTGLRADTNYITLDPGFGNTGACKSSITFIDGEKGILRHRGYAVEDLCEKCSFVEVSWLILFGELPSEKERKEFEQSLVKEMQAPEELKSILKCLSPNTHPMAVLSTLVSALTGFSPEVLNVNEDESYKGKAIKLVAKIATFTSWIFRFLKGEDPINPNPELSFVDNILYMMFDKKDVPYVSRDAVVKVINLFLILHIDHEQNCSTSTVRVVGSSKANMYSAVSAGISALWGPLHGGANAAVIAMLNEINESDATIQEFVTKAKDKTSGFRLMGFGHRVYKNYDPRAKILRSHVDKVLDELDVDDPSLDIAKKLREIALADDYFTSRKLYPNVDFFSGILLRALTIPENMFTVMFALGRTTGWISHWIEGNTTPGARISRPRQIYVGPKLRSIVK